jgi:O-antigen/teichoic acid export membrane protein
MHVSDDLTAEAVTNRDVAKGAGTTLLARLGGVIDVVAQPLYVWMFGLASFGLYAVLWSAVNLIENIADLGMTSALQRTVPQAKTKQAEMSALRAAVLVGVGPCILIAAIVSFTAPAFTHIFNAAPEDEARMAHTIALFIWTLPLWAFVEVATSALRSKRVFGAEIRLRLFWEQVVRFGLAGGLWLLGFSTMALFYAHLASLSIICVLCIRLLSQHFDLRLALKGPLIDDAWRGTVAAGLTVLPSNIVARLFGDAPQLILNAWIPGAAGAAAAGLYVIARKVSSIVQLVRTAFVYVLAPLASFASTGSKESVREIYGFATRVSFAVAVPLGIVLAACSPAILATFGTEAAPALWALVILICARILEAICGAATPIQQVISKFRSQLVGSILGLGVAAIAVWLIMPEGGLTGITIAVALGLIVAAATPLWQVHAFDGLHPFARPFGRVAIRTLGISAIGLALALAINMLPIFAQLPLLLPVLAATLWASARFGLSREDRVALGKTGRKLKLV